MPECLMLGAEARQETKAPFEEKRLDERDQLWSNYILLFFSSQLCFVPHHSLLLDVELLLPCFSFLTSCLSFLALFALFFLNFTDFFYCLEGPTPFRATTWFGPPYPSLSSIRSEGTSTPSFSRSPQLPFSLPFLL